MARIIGGVTTSHILAVGNANANRLSDDPYWKPFFDGYPKILGWLHAYRPDVAVNIYNDQVSASSSRP